MLYQQLNKMIFADLQLQYRKGERTPCTGSATLPFLLVRDNRIEDCMIPRLLLLPYSMGQSGMQL
jgi:hypothetical protein